MPRIVQFFEFGLPRTRSRSILVFLPSVLSPDKFQKGSLLGPTAMHSYRAYLLDAYEHIIDSIDLTCGEDESTRARPESLWADTQWSSGTTRARSRRLSHIGTTFVARTTNPGISRHLCSLDGLRWHGERRQDQARRASEGPRQDRQGAYGCGHGGTPHSDVVPRARVGYPGAAKVSALIVLGP